MAKAKTAKVENKTKVFSSQWFKENWITILWSFVLVAFVATLTTFICLSVSWSAKQGFPDDKGKPQLRYDNWYTWFDNKDKASWTAVPKLYWIPFGLGAALALSIIIGVGSWLRGSKWINKSNPFVKGQVYVRTKFQTIVFRVLTLCLAAIFWWSFILDSVFANIDHGGAGSFLENTWKYVMDPGSWYFQCFLSSLFFGLVIIFKKYKLVKILYPMAFIGAVRTFADIHDWVGSDGGWKSIVFHRSVVEHMLLIFGPIFIIVANREKYSLKDIRATVIYTFVMVFIPYVVDCITTMTHDDKANPDNGNLWHHWGEQRGIIEWWGLGGKAEDAQKAWFAAHHHLFFWCMYVPFGVALVAAVIFTVNFFSYKSEAKGNWGQRWCSVWKEYGRDVKINQWLEFKASFTNLTTTFRVKKEKPVPFGVDPKEWEARKRK